MGDGIDSFEGWKDAVEVGDVGADAGEVHGAVGEADTIVAIGEVFAEAGADLTFRAGDEHAFLFGWRHREVHFAY